MLERQNKMTVSIRRFEKHDIPNKVRWINNPENNTFLHYDLPLEIDKTEAWFDNNKGRTDRYDAVIEADGVPVGLIGLLSIDNKNKKAEYYVTLGERKYLGRGIAARATKLLLEYAFTELNLNRVYLYTEVDNSSAVRSYERIGFRREGVIKDDLFSKGRFVDRYVYRITKEDFYSDALNSALNKTATPINRVTNVSGNALYVKRDDFIPFSFGGNKARKAELFFAEIDQGGYDCVVTYGSGSSNHCRIVANMAAARNMPCYIISPEEADEDTYNKAMMKYFGATFTVCPVRCVSDTIESKLTELKESGRNPYFIAGGGHGNLGTKAYVNCYEEICQYERDCGISFDYIFHASGTGTTQAGLVCGKLIRGDKKEIIGISIARRTPRGRDVVLDSVREYLKESCHEFSDCDIEAATVFVDDYVGGGYGESCERIDNVIRDVMVNYGIPLDHTYTGKAFSGMLDYIEKKDISGKNILFIHTGGTPLYFDHLNKEINKKG